jgi:enoyl-CoA hydratase
MRSSEGTEPPVLIERRGRVGHLTLNRPRAINALTGEMVGMLRHALELWRNNDGVATVLLTGAGDRGLCAGGDIVSIYHDALASGTASEAFWRDEYALNAEIARYPKPIVALQDGIVLGGGIGVSAHAGIRIVTETSRLGMPETAIGFVPDVGGTWLLARAPGDSGTHAALTAAPVGAGDALFLGLADHFVERAHLPALVEALETEDAALVVARFGSTPPPGELADARWIDTAYAGDSVADILARLADVLDPAAQAAYAAISTNSPTALAVTLAALRRARRAPDLGTVLAQEFRVSLRCLAEPDFAEGIRAQVIDKDRTPAWRPGSIAEVDPHHIEEFFAPLGDRELALDQGAR